MASGHKKQIYDKKLIDDFHREKTILGPHSGFVWKDDAKHLLFQLARAKFCAKLLAGLDRVLDVGCGDGTAMNLLAQSVGRVVGIETDPAVIECCPLANKHLKNCEYRLHDISKAPLDETFDAAYSLDVIEHVPRTREAAFLRNICESLTVSGICIVGTPNITAKDFSSDPGHINLKDHKTLKALVGRYFHNTFLFSMNDEVVHTGFYPMAHYLFALGCHRKR